ncbi:DUF2335 domain-containing protein [Streptomyces hoynatensis]|uniref:DUF2335 domain-containing protein n=1 Tax=Streptomyces hoynatensis TaxID=1141874 RepID=A0A3A9Z7D5_9ACTN|nr:DUF2335 domain-containing protein [Streptomyces hoynatensis]RKN43804.1 DUF2335 domain-containing protein [Streptomyces hoynatensis]
MSEPMPFPEPPAPEPPAQPGGWQDLPVAEQIASWERAVPGSAERMLRQIEAEYEHRRWLDRVEIRFRIAGAVLAAFGVTGLLWTAKYLVDQGEPVAGAGLLGSGVVALSGLVMARDRSRR